MIPVAVEFVLLCVGVACFGEPFCDTAGYRSFYPTAQCVAHALIGLACHTPVLLAHAEVTKNIIFLMGPKLRYPTVVAVLYCFIPIYNILVCVRIRVHARACLCVCISAENLFVLAGCAASARSR